MPSMSAPTSFVDGVVVHQADLNNLSTNIDTLCQITNGKTAASGVSSKPMVKVSLNAPMTIATNTDVLVVWNVANFNTDNMWVSSAANQLTVNTAGKYRIYAQGDFVPNGTGTRSVKIFVNGTANANAVGATQIANATASFDTLLSCSALESLSAGATIYMDVYQSSGANLNLDLNVSGTFMNAEWVAP